MRHLKGFLQALGDPEIRPGAARVALIVGTLLFSINHGSALAQGKMTSSRWLAGLITYAVPYSVSAHGRYSYRSRQS